VGGEERDWTNKQAGGAKKGGVPMWLRKSSDENVCSDHVVRKRGNRKVFSGHLIRKRGENVMRKILGTAWLGEEVMKTGFSDT
jgi:hypothetical protein